MSKINVPEIPRGSIAEFNRAFVGWLNDIRRILIALAGVVVTNTLTLSTGTTSTVVSSDALTADSWIGFMPLTANAAAAVSGMYVTGQADGTATINHAASAQTDRTFRLVIFG